MGLPGRIVTGWSRNGGGAAVVQVLSGAESEIRLPVGDVLRSVVSGYSNLDALARMVEFGSMPGIDESSASARDGAG
jgi:hypothetical protein